MKPDFTENQKKAITGKGNILVSAAAGSGKTAVLAERVVAKLTDTQNPVSADRLLIVTFTEAAAKEMKSRIEARLTEKCNECPQNIEWLKQKHLLSCADICTIDSFCVNFIRENFHLCGVEPDFKVGNDSVYAEECGFILRNMITERLKSGDKTFLKLLDILGCEKSTYNLEELITSVYKRSLNMPFPDEYLDNFETPFKTDFNNDSVYCKELMRLARAVCASLNKYVEKLKEDALLIEKENGHIAYANSYAEELSYLTAAAISGDYEALYKAVDTYRNFKAVKNPSKPRNDDTAIPFITNINILKDIDKKLFGIIEYSAEEINRQNAELLPVAKLIAELVKDYTKRVDELYKENNFLSFATCERTVFSLLCDKKDGDMVLSEKAYDYLSRYDEVLVDEFQDVNNLQNMLFFALSDCEKNLFAVGDVKQSIYRFRGSNPKNFTEKKERYIPFDDAKEGEPQKIVLADNFRSRKGVCDYVNYFFSLIMNAGDSETEYKGDELLNAKAKFPPKDGADVEIIMADKASDDSEDEAKAAEYEAECIAGKILSTVNSGYSVRKDKESTRNADFGDIAVLLPAIKSKSEIYARVFKKYGIPVSLGGENYIESIEISVMLSLLQVIDNPFCDIDLINVMMSDIYGFSADEIAEIRAEHKKESMYSSVCKAAESNEKAKAFIDSIEALRYDSRMLPLSRFVGKVMLETGHLDCMSAMESGTVRRKNLFKLTSFANEYSESWGKTLSGFVKYMKGLPEEAFDTKGVPSGNTVKVITIHNSKGLQFPICFVAGISTTFNKKDSIGRVLYNPEYGLGIKYYDYQSDRDISAVSHKIIANAERSATLQEKVRLMYVAMTRAEEKLIIVTSFGDLARTAQLLNTAAFDLLGNIDYSWFSSETVLSKWVLAACLKDAECEQIRTMVENPVMPIKSNCRYDVTVIGNAKSEVKEQTQEACGADEHLSEKIRQNISYVYPYKSLGSVRAKASVSALAESKANERFYFTEKPEFMLESGVSASGRGTAVHRVMQFIRFDEKPDVKAEIERLKEWQYISEQQAAATDVGQIERFFESELYKRILKSNDVRREMRFLSEIEAYKMNPDIEESLKDTPVVIQGAVDLCFAEDDGIVVVDFKTDRVDNKEQLLELYGAQLSIYSDACEKIFERKVKERIIYSFTLSKEISL